MIDTENLFTSRQAPWVCDQKPTSTVKAALHQAGLHWTVEKRPIYTETQVPLDEGPAPKLYMAKYNPIPDNWATVRSSDQAVLGVVGKRYHIIQNHEAFAFLDELQRNEGLVFEAAGTIKDDAIWIVGSLNKFKAAGDEYQNYVYATSSHTGHVALTAGTFSLRLSSQTPQALPSPWLERSMKILHTMSIQDRVDTASRLLARVRGNERDLSALATKWTKKPVSPAMLQSFIEGVFPTLGESKKAQTLQARYSDEFRYRLAMAPDLEGIRGTAWGVVQALLDFVFHRERQVYKGNDSTAMAALLFWDPLIDKAMKVLEGLL